MSGEFYLDWAITSISLFNAILLLWLGLTVLLNAERRTWGMWLSGGGLLMGSGFFLSHSAILGHGLDYLGQGIDFWWRIGWMMVIALPFAWYVIMLWYTGLWENALRLPPLVLRTRNLWQGITWLLVVCLLSLAVLALLLPSFAETTPARIINMPAVGNLPLLAVLYPFYIVLCLGLSLYALLRPGPSERAMGDLARRRARPWMIATTVALLAVSIVVTWVMVWVLVSIGPRTLPGLYDTGTLILTRFDCAIAALIALSVILLGQAIVSYEIFTGKTLPRGGFHRYWQRAILLGIGYSAVVGWSLTIQLRPIYGFLLTAILVVVFYALLSWRSFAERERTIQRLRPFVTSQQVYEHVFNLSSSSALPDLKTDEAFRALCEEVLDARSAYLAAIGPMAGLFGAALSYSPSSPWKPLNLTEIIEQLDAPDQICLPLTPNPDNEAILAVPLWSERGIIGVLLLGEKRDNGLYTQEEIEIARAIGERLIDTQASAEMARRLMDLQRRQLAETQVIDRQTRRALHDDILPQLHTTMLTLSATSGISEQTIGETMDQLGQIHRQISNLLRSSPVIEASEVAREGLFTALKHTLEHELSQSFDHISWEIEEEVERKACEIPPLTAEVLFYAAREAIRNAACHGRDNAGGETLNLKVAADWSNGLRLQVEDDGVGLRSSTEKRQNSGHGLALHSTMMSIVGGSLEIESEPDRYTRVTLTSPQC